MEQKEEEALNFASAACRTSIGRSVSCTHVQQVWASLNKFFQLMALFGAMLGTCFGRKSQEACENV
jgi:hypothetical protein